MGKRSYTKLQCIEDAILELKNQGKTNREIAEQYGIKERQIVNLINRRNRREKQLVAGKVPQKKGRPSNNPEREIERLRMENKLLRDFLQLSERM